MPMGSYILFVVIRNGSQRIKGCGYILFLLAVLIQSYPWIYIVDDIDGRVVDVHGEPIEGVLVTSYWSTVYVFRTYGIESIYKHKAGILEASEAITDKDGRYHIPGFWKLRPFFQEIHSGFVDAFKKDLYHDPHISIYQKDMRTEILGLFHEDYADGSIFVMRDIKTDFERSVIAEGLGGFIDAVMDEKECMWMTIPNSLVLSWSPEPISVEKKSARRGWC